MLLSDLRHIQLLLLKLSDLDAFRSSKLFVHEAVCAAAFLKQFFNKLDIFKTQSLGKIFFSTVLQCNHQGAYIQICDV